MRILLAAVQIFHPVDGCACGPSREKLQSPVRLGCKVSPLEAGIEVVLRFVQRSERVSGEFSGITRQIATKPFRQVPRRGRTGSSDLAAIFHISRDEPGFSKCVHLSFQFARQLPGDQIFESSNDHGCGKVHGLCRTRNSVTLELCNLGTLELCNPETLEP